MNETAAVVLDLDGVIVKSNFIKHQAMLSLFGSSTDELEQISLYILANGGVRRDEKIIHILKNILGIEPTKATLDSYLSRYAKELEGRLAVASLVEGIGDFLTNGAYTFYVSSSAPEVEVREQLARFKLEACFARIYGASTPKARALRQVSALHPTVPVVFFGDSVGDWEAAKEANVSFVAVVCERDNFANQPVAKLSSFQSLACVREAMKSAGI